MEKTRWNKIYGCWSKAEFKAYRKQYYIENHSRMLQRQRLWRLENPNKVKLYLSRGNHKGRSFGFIPLNEPFEGSEAHHLDKRFTIYIPKEVHRSIYHCLGTYEGMNEINKYAIDFIKEKIMELVLKY